MPRFRVYSKLNWWLILTKYIIYFILRGIVKFPDLVSDDLKQNLPQLNIELQGPSLSFSSLHLSHHKGIILLP